MRTAGLPLTSLLFLAIVGLGCLNAGQSASGAEKDDAKSPESALKLAHGLGQAFSHVAKTVRPSVVNITSIKRLKVAGRGRSLRDPWFHNHPFRDFFGNDFFDQFFRQQKPHEGYEQRGLGTGVIVDKEGHILTNNHVVKGADEIQIKLYDGKTIKAKLVGSDDKTDLAVLKVTSGNLKPATLGNSDKLAVGEWVIAVGNPFGLTQTVTAGIVSAKGRANVGIVDYEDFIQTDAAINPGNSGGPLVDLKGKVIGINTAIVSRSGGYQGIGFAIPINMAGTIMKSLMKEGRVDRGWLGVLIQNLDENLSKSFGHSGTQGVLIGDVTKDGPAEKAGLKPGDILLRFGGTEVRDVNHLRNLVAATAPGTSVAVEVVRERKKETLAVKVGQLEGNVSVAKNEDESEKLGLTVRALTPDIVRQLGLDEKEGVAVVAVAPGSAAADAGLRPGDVIVAVNGENVTDVASFRTASRKRNLKEGIRMRVRSKGATRFVFLKRSE